MVETARQRIFSGGVFEGTVGYARAVRVEQFVFVSGTIATGPNGELLGGNDPEAQAVAAIEKIGRALAEAGATFADVVRTRLYVTNADVQCGGAGACALFHGCTSREHIRRSEPPDRQRVPRRDRSGRDHR